jgi:hypothetical protein
LINYSSLYSTVLNSTQLKIWVTQNTLPLKNFDKMPSIK